MRGEGGACIVFVWALRGESRFCLANAALCGSCESMGNGWTARVWCGLGPWMALGFTFVLVAGCTDAAQKDYEQCEALEKQGKFEEALAACQKAQEKDARSVFGAKAISLESKLHDKIAEQKEKSEREAKEAQQDEALEQANQKVQMVLVSTPPNDPQGYSERCMARNRAYENSYKCEPKDPSSAPEGEAFPFKDECQIVAKSRGCMPFYEGNVTKMFCCTK